MQVMRTLGGVLLFAAASAFAHPSVSVVIDSRGNVYYSDLTTPSGVGNRRAAGYCDGTYVGSCVAESMTDAYAVTLPVPLSTFTVTRAL